MLNKLYVPNPSHDKVLDTPLFLCAYNNSLNFHIIFIKQKENLDRLDKKIIPRLPSL